MDTAQDSRGWFLTALGMVVPDDVTALGTDEFFADFSGERIGLLDVDMLWWAGSPSSVKDGSLYARLDVSTEGRDGFFPDESTLGGALSFQTVLSLPYFLDAVTARMVALLDGGPAAEPSPVE